MIENEEKMLQLLSDRKYVTTMEAVEKAKKDFNWSRKHRLLSKISENFNDIVSIINIFATVIILAMNISLIDRQVFVNLTASDTKVWYLIILFLIEMTIEPIIKSRPIASGHTWLDYLSAEDVLKINKLMLFELHLLKEKPFIYIWSKETDENKKFLWIKTSKPVTHRVITVIE